MAQEKKMISLTRICVYGADEKRQNSEQILNTDLQDWDKEVKGESYWEPEQVNYSQVY